MRRRQFLGAGAAVLQSALAEGGRHCVAPATNLAPRADVVEPAQPHAFDGGSAAPECATPGAGAITFQAEFNAPERPLLHGEGGPFNPVFTYFGGPPQPDSPYGYRWFNDEQQVYTTARYAPAPFHPFSISNGVLTITGRPARPDYPNAPRPYVSGMLETSNGGRWEAPALRRRWGGFEQKYGYWEARMRMPAGKGLWCSFWLNGGADAAGKVGEIDIFETTGDGAVHQTIHDWWAAADPNDSTAYRPARFDYTQWHTYALHWTANEIVWYVDGAETKRAGAQMVARYRDLCGPMFLVTGMGMGSPRSWGGAPDASVPWPARMQIHYIRVRAA